MLQDGARSGPRPRILLLSVTLLAFALRAGGLVRQSLWRDEVDALMFATRPLAQVLELFRKPGENGPLFYLLLRPWLMAAGTREFSLRFISALAATAAAPLVYVLVRRLAGHSRRPALLAALLIACAPYLVWYGQEAKMYGLLTFLVPATLLLTVEAARRGGWWRWALLYALTTASIYIHFLAALIVPVQILWLLIVPLPDQAGRRVSPARRWLWAVVYPAALFLPYAPLLRWQAPMWLSTFQTGHPFVPLAEIFRIILAVFSLGIAGSGGLLLLPYMLGLVAGAILWPLQGREGGRPDRDRVRIAALLLIWFLLPPVMIYLVSLGMPIFTERYLIWSAPAFFALIALGADALLRAGKPIGLFTLAAVLALNIYGLVLQDRPIKADFRAAAAFVLAHRQPGDVLIFQIPYNRYTFTYYASPTHDPQDTARPWLDGPYTNRPVTEAQVDDWMRRGLDGAFGAWLIASEVPLWDEQGMTEKWLAGHGTAQDHAEFSRVAVTRYELKPP
jgi:mannosyltransferase